ncbi:MAG: hypothetical protein ACJ79G_23870 [Myxococcales bacterium]
MASTHGVHGCRAEDLACWPDDELWLVELGGPILHELHQLVATRGRLLKRIAGWNADTVCEYAGACAWRAGDLALEDLDRAGLAAASAALRSCIDLVNLEATATILAGGDTRGRSHRRVAGPCASAGRRASAAASSIGLSGRFSRKATSRAATASASSWSRCFAVIRRRAVRQGVRELGEHLLLPPPQDDGRDPGPEEVEVPVACEMPARVEPS